MSDKTTLVLPGRKMIVPRLFKRTVQTAIAVALTTLVILAVMVANGLFAGRGASLQGGINIWLSFIKRPDIYTTMILTALVSITFVYWHRDRERK